MPLSKIIVQLYALIIEVGLWGVLLASLIFGWKAGGFAGAIGSLISATILASVFFGAFIVLNEIRDRVKAIEMKQSG